MSKPFVIRTQHTINFDQAEKDTIIRLCVEAHNEPDFENLFLYLPPDGLHISGYLGEQLVSHAVVTTRWMQPEGHAVLKSAYVDAVSTAPAMQGMGYGSAVMRHLADVIRNDYAIAGLHTSDKQQFYERVGWEEWRGALAGRKEDGDLTYTPDERSIMILRLPRTPTLNLDGLLTIEISGRIW